MYGGPETIDLDGAETPFAPEWTGNVGVGYNFRLAGNFFGGNPLDVTPRVDVAYRSDSYARLFQNRATLLEGYTLVNAQMRFESGPWSLVLWGTNLTDKEYVAAKQNIDTAGPTATRPFDHFTGIVYGGLRRLYGLRLSVDL
jgi:iron complex outermembrane receptor protein